MRRLLCISLLLLCSAMAWANACTTPGSGNACTAGTWTSCSGTFPQSTDTYTVTSPNTVTIQSGCSWNPGAGVVNQGGTLTVAIGGTYTAAGNITVQGGGTSNFNGAVTLTGYFWQALGTGTGNVMLTFGNGSTVTNGYFDGSTNPSRTALTFNGGTFSSCGSASQYCMKVISGTGQDILATSGNKVVFNGSGTVYLRTSVSTNNIQLDRVDFRNCLDTAYTYSCMLLYGPAAGTGLRTLTRITGYNPSAGKNIEVELPGVKIGNDVRWGDSSNVPGILGYRTIYSGDTAVSGGKVGQSILTYDTAWPSGANQLYLTPSACGVDIVDDISFIRYSNQHHFAAATGVGCSGSADHWHYLVADGDGYYSTDAGDVVTPSGTGPATIDHILAINSAGTLFTINSASPALTMTQSTSYNSMGGTLGENACGAGTLVGFRDNLIVSPSTQQTAGEDGIHQGSSACSQTSLSLDYNAWFGSGFNASNLPNAAQGGAISYMGPQTVPYISGSTYGTTPGFGTHDLHTDPQFKDSTRTMCSWGNSIGLSLTCPSADTANLIAIGQEIVKLNGTDYQGNSATPNSQATAENAMSYFTVGFTPQAAALKSAGSPTDGSPDIGAFPVVLRGSNPFWFGQTF